MGADGTEHRDWLGYGAYERSRAPRVPVLRPRLPTADALTPYLREIDANRWYTNHGPLLERFEAGLAQRLGVAPAHVLAVSNGTVTLTLALEAMGCRPGQLCLMPSWTFVATAAAACAANLVPHFIDVDPATWQLDPERLAARGDLAAVGAVIVVSAFGAPVPLAPWDAFTAHTGIPVLIDAASGLDGAAIEPAAHTGCTPVMFSLHATKAFGIGEGGLLLTADPAVMERARRISNFGFAAEACATIVGGNAKVSEYHAAVGLAALDQWPARRAALIALTARYRRRLAAIERLQPSPGFGEGWVSSYCNVRLDADAVSVATALAAAGIETRRWWRNGCHADAAYAACPRDPLPATEALARSVLGLPFFADMSDADLDEVVAALDRALERAAPVLA